MGIVRKQSFYNTLIFYAGMLLGYVSMLVVLPNVITDEQYGLVRILFPFASVFTLFYLLGIPNIVIRYFPFYRNEKTSHGGFLFFLFLVTGISTVLFTLLFFLIKGPILAFYAKDSPLLVQNYYYALPLAMAIAFFELMNAYLKVNFLSVFPTFLNEVYVRLMIIVLAGMYYFGWIGFYGFLGLYVSIYVSSPIILLFYMKVKKILYIKPRPEIFSKASLTMLGTYGAFNFFGGATGALVDKVDVLFVGSLGLDLTGVYGVAIMLAQAVALPAKALSFIVNPLVAEAQKENDREKKDMLYKSTSRNQFLAGCFILTVIAANFHSFFAIVHPEFQAAFIPFLILGCARLFDMVTSINGMLIVVSRYFRYDIAFSVLLLGVTILNNALLIPLYGMKGAAIATFIALIVYNLARYLFVLVKMKLQPFTWHTLRILIFTAVVLLGLYFIPSISNPYIDIVIRTVVCGTSFMVGLLAFRLSPEIHDLVTGQYNRMLQLVKRSGGKD